MTAEQERIVARLRKAMADATKAGLVTFCDVDAWGIRLVPKEEIADFDSDPRDHGEIVDAPDEGPIGRSKEAMARMGDVVRCESTCGTPVGPRDGLNAL